MDVFEAIERRVSCRSYSEKPVEQEKLERLAAAVERANGLAGSGARFELVRAAGPEVPCVRLSRAMFSGQPRCYIACICPDDAVAREQVGYFGEELVLFATQLGLGTCWVAGTYDAETLAVEPAEGEGIASIIPVGYETEKTPLKQRTIRAALHAKDKPYERLVAGDVAGAPAWFEPSVRAATAAPTAVNLQPVTFTWENGTASASLPSNARSVQEIDLGICKLHFKLGSRQKGTWEWGSGGQFAL